jgi:hypothetical protein
LIKLNRQPFSQQPVIEHLDPQQQEKSGVFWHLQGAYHDIALAEQGMIHEGIPA